MKLRIIVSITLFALLSVFLLKQVDLVHAQMPATSPATAFKLVLSGTVTYRNFFRLFGGHNTPAKNVTVKAKNKSTNQTVTTTTDNNGHYAFNLDEGKYRVEASQPNVLFIPFFKNVNLNKNRSNVDFKGIR